MHLRKHPASSPTAKVTLFFEVSGCSLDINTFFISLQLIGNQLQQVKSIYKYNILSFHYELPKYTHDTGSPGIKAKPTGELQLFAEGFWCDLQSEYPIKLHVYCIKASWLHCRS